VAAQAAGRGAVPLERISFKGTLDALRHYPQGEDYLFRTGMPNSASAIGLNEG
jgi:hypothetical protein